MEGSGGCAQYLQDIRAPFGNTDLRYLNHLVPAALVPLRGSSTDARSFDQRLIALGIVGVDGLPWREEEHLPMIRIRRQVRPQLAVRQRPRLVQHAKRVDDAALEEDEAGPRRLLPVLLDILAEDALRELKLRRPGT